MAIDTVKMDELFPVCRDILKKELKPIHYTDLTAKALQYLGLTENDVNWQRQIEDVREKMLLAGQYKTFYIGKPYCLAGLRWWFESDQLRLINPTTGIKIPGDASAGADGAFEALMRDPNMKIKTTAPIERIAKVRTSGLVLEKHVAYWFKKNWPVFYLPPDNERQWATPCNHDFKLKIKNNIFKVDVTGKRLNGNYGNPGEGKRAVDFHLLCEIIGPDVLWHSVYRGSDYKKIIIPEGQSFNGMWPERMIVWLNCLRDGIDYQAIKSFLKPKALEVA